MTSCDDPPEVALEVLGGVGDGEDVARPGVPVGSAPRASPLAVPTVTLATVITSSTYENQLRVRPRAVCQTIGGASRIVIVVLDSQVWLRPTVQARASPQQLWLCSLAAPWRQSRGWERPGHQRHSGQAVMMSVVE